MAKKTKKPTSKDYEKIISIQEGIIKSKEQENIQSWNTWINTWDAKDDYQKWYNDLWYENQELQRKNQNLTKDYYEIVRAYNALLRLGTVAKELGVDVQKHYDQLPENNMYKDFDFKIENKVLETGKVKTIYRATKKKEKSNDK